MGGKGHTAVLCDGKIYIGGSNEGGLGSHSGTRSYRIDIYSPINNSWSPSPIKNPCCWFAMTTLNNQLITAGGMDRMAKITNKIFLLDGDNLREYTRMNTPRYWASAAGYRGSLIITGGIDNQVRVLATTELFDSTTEQWYTTSDLPLPHYRLKSVIVDNILYLMGGHNEDHRYSQGVFAAPLNILSSQKLLWSSQQDIPRFGSGPVSILGRNIVAVGGRKKTASYYVHASDIHMFNKVSHSWDIIGQIPSAREAPAAVSLSNHKIIVVGGFDDKDQYTDTVWIGSCESQ